MKFSAPFFLRDLLVPGVSVDPFPIFMSLTLLLGLGGAFSVPATAATTANAAQASDQAKTGEEADTGENVYRHSASVRYIGRWFHLDPETAATVFEFFNFAVLAGVILYFLLKNLPKTFRANRETIQHQLVDARTATEQSRERLAAIEQRLARLDDEIAGSPGRRRRIALRTKPASKHRLKRSGYASQKQ